MYVVLGTPYVGPPCRSTPCLVCLPRLGQPGQYQHDSLVMLHCAIRSKNNIYGNTTEKNNSNNMNISTKASIIVDKKYPCSWSFCLSTTAPEATLETP